MKKDYCRNCTFYVAYYQQWSAHYSKLNNGFCQKQSCPKTQFETCAQYKSNEQKQARRLIRLFDKLDESLQYIHDIKQILQERSEELDKIE